MKAYVLVEEFENKDILRESSNLVVSRTFEEVKRLFDKAISEDEYGMIKDNGVSTHTESEFETNYKDGFIAYYIEEHELI